MSKEQLLHIFDESACLTRRQMKDYVTGGMTNEESHAVEVHLNACPFCNDAIEGLFAQQEGNTVEMITTLDSNFLNDHLGKNNPRIHLNSVTATHAHQHTHKRKQGGNVTAFWRNTSIAAILLLAVGLLWFLKFGRDNNTNNRQLAQQAETQTLPPTSNTQQPVTITEDAATTPAPIKTTIAAVPPSENPIDEIKVTPQAPGLAAVDAATQKQDNNTAERQKKALTDEVVVTQYKAPLVDKYEPSAKAMKTEQVEKMPTRTTNSIAATAPGAYTGDSKREVPGSQNEDVSYTIEGVSTRSANAVAKDNLVKAEGLFNKGEYESALRVYSREFDSEDKGYRQKAMVMAAQCHNKLGNKSKAKTLLQSVIDEGGPEKKAARKLLKELESSK